VTSKTYQDATTQLRADYSYDLNGNVLTATRYADVAGTTPVGLTQYGYAGNRLTALQHQDGSGGVLADFSYSYDAADRLTSETDDGVTTSYAYDAAGELTQDGSQSFAYDSNGNRSGTGLQTGPN